MKDMIFLMEKQEQYVPQLASTEKSNATKEASQEDTEE
jgi:hypothetical protein